MINCLDEIQAGRRLKTLALIDKHHARRRRIALASHLWHNLVRAGWTR